MNLETSATAAAAVCCYVGHVQLASRAMLK